MEEDKVLINTTTKITVEIFKFEILQKMNKESEMLNRSWDELINIAIEKLLNDIEMLRDLRSTKELF